MTDRTSSPANIGARLKDAREYRGFSREEIARYLQTTPSEVSHIESGSRPLDAGTISRLAKLYKTTVEHLTGNAREAPEPESVRRSVQTAADISPTDGNEVRRFVRYLHSTRQAQQNN